MSQEKEGKRRLTDGLEVGVRFAPETVADGEHFDVVAGARVQVLEEDARLLHLPTLQFGRVVAHVDDGVLVLFCWRTIKRNGSFHRFSFVVLDKKNVRNGNAVSGEVGKTQ